MRPTFETFGDLRAFVHGDPTPHRWRLLCDAMESWPDRVELHLYGNSITDEGARALARTPYLSRTRHSSARTQRHHATRRVGAGEVSYLKRESEGELREKLDGSVVTWWERRRVRRGRAGVLLASTSRTGGAFEVVLFAETILQEPTIRSRDTIWMIDHVDESRGSRGDL